MAQATETAETSATESEADRVAEQLRQRIFDGRLAAGERLVQHAIAAELGVSRLPVRTALGILAHDGLVETRERRGTVVRAFGPRDLADLVAVHTALDLLAVRLAADRATDDDRAEMTAADARMADALAVGDMDAARAVLMRMRSDLIRAARNEVLSQASAVIDQRMRHLFGLIDDPRVLRGVARDLCAVLESGDGEAAEKQMAERLEQSRNQQRDQLIATLHARQIPDLFDDDHDPLVDAAAASVEYHREELRLGIETERVLGELRASILDHRRAAGSRLSERAIAEELGAGRIPTRRAIETLVAEGLAAPGGPRSAARVRPLTSEAALDMLQVSERLSALTLRSAGERLDRAGLRDLRALQRVIDEVDDVSLLPEAMEAFRMRLLDVADNDALCAVDAVVRWRMMRYMAELAEIEVGRDFCRSFYNALALRDPALAERSVRAVFAMAINGRAGSPEG